MNFIISENVQEVVFIFLQHKLIFRGSGYFSFFFLLYLLLVSSTRFVENKFIKCKYNIITDSYRKLAIRKLNRQFSSGNGDHEF